MTITGRTTPKWGRDRSARWDSNPENGFRTRSYPHVAPKPEAMIPEPEAAHLVTRPGHAERDLTLTRRGDEVSILLKGWYTTALDLNERQLLFLRDTLNAWFPEESHPR
jgi:hypothetical protein